MISVIIGVYNNEKTIETAVLSMINQTLPPDEIIICDDASTDNTYQILLQLKENYPNIILIRNTKNMGLAHSLNCCLKIAKGDFIARMDGDDFSYPDRISKQIAFLNNHSKVDFVGCGGNFVFENKVLEKVVYPEFPDSLTLIKYNPFIHPTIVFKKSAILDVGGYDENATRFRCEDYDLMFRLYQKNHLGANIQEVLFDYTENPNYKKHSFVSRKNEFTVKKYGFKILKLPFKYFIYAIKPLVFALIPHFLYKKLKNFRRQNVEN